MNATDRNAIKKAFMAAKRYLRGNGNKRGEKYICWAIEEACYFDEISAEEYWLAREIINDRLTTHGLWSVDIETYLKNVVGVPYRKQNVKDVQAFRHRWLDALIKEFS